MAVQRGDYRRASELLEDGLARSRNWGDNWYTALQLNALGQIPLRRGDYGQATARFEEALGVSRQVGDRLLIMVSLSDLALVRQARGDLTGATGLLEEGLSLAAEAGDDAGIAHYLDGLAALAQRQEDPERAGRLHGAVETAGSGWLQAFHVAPAGPSPQRPGVVTAAFERARAEGAALGRRRDVQYALRKDRRTPPTTPGEQPRPAIPAEPSPPRPTTIIPPKRQRE